MGQQQEEIVAGGSMLRRIVLALTVATLMAAMLAASAMPAMAKASPNPSETGGGPPLFTGGLELDNPSSEVFHGRGGACVKHFGKNAGKETGGSC
jgi:Spy/CpxP family protein refolding chaperone